MYFLLIFNEYKILKELILFNFLFITILLLFKNDYEIPPIINEPILPENNEEYIVKEYNKSNFNLNNPRFHFQDKYGKRKIFKINYSYYPYTKISKNITFEDNAINIYNTSGMLNITKLEYYYYGKNNVKINILNLNHIHISMSFDEKYSDLALISIASILNTSNIDTYIHFHILGLNFRFEVIEKVINLRKINNKVDFIFYNAKQAEYDFKKGKYDNRGFGVFAKILIPQIVNNTNKILILDSGDILSQKDLCEIYFYDIGDNYFGWILERCAGNRYIYEDKFMTNNYHPNTGVVLVNIRLFRKDELYKKALFVDKSYHYFKSPTQDILITVANYKFKYIPLNYNIHLYYEKEEYKLNKTITPAIRSFLKVQRFTKYKYSIDEIFNAMDDPVIHHFYMEKIQNKSECNSMVVQWLKYAKLVGVFKQLRKIYPKPFRCIRYMH